MISPLNQCRQEILDALRSGKYRQIRGNSHDGRGGYCVMGLASAIARRQCLMLLDIFNLPRTKAMPDSFIRPYVQLNDTGKKDFHQFADMFEEYFMQNTDFGLAKDKVKSDSNVIQLTDYLAREQQDNSGIPLDVA